MKPRAFLYKGITIKVLSGLSIFTSFRFDKPQYSIGNRLFDTLHQAKSFINSF